MGKSNKILLCGCSGVGKTAILEQLLYGNHVVESPTHQTMEDIYTAVIETDRGVKEKVRIFDLGMPDGNDADLPKHYLTLPDGFILVYDVTNFESFKRLDRLKKEIDKHRDKREGHMIVIGNKSELNDRRQVQFETAMAWSSKEKNFFFGVGLGMSPILFQYFSIEQGGWACERTGCRTVRLWEVTVTNRKSLVDPFVWLTSKITQPTGKSNFLPGRKTKSSSSSNLDKN